MTTDINGFSIGNRSAGMPRVLRQMADAHDSHVKDGRGARAILPDAFKASVLELLPEYMRAANAAVARLPIMVQIKSGEMTIHGDRPEESGK